MSQKIVIVRKKKVAGHGHHGGSWKVAYADFVTAMMAFFMVMWIMGMDQGVKDIVQGYFNNPIGFKQAFSGGRNPLSQGSSILSVDLQTALLMRRGEEEAALQEAADRIERRLQELGITEEVEAMVEVVVTDQGLRIEMMETGGGEIFFDRSSSELKPALRLVLATVAAQIAGLDNGVVIEGHTDAARFGGFRYSNWELSADRANAARRELLQAGMPEDHILEVRGHAARQPKFPESDLDPRNRRISLLLPFDSPDPVEGAIIAGPGSDVGIVGLVPGSGGDE